MLFSKSLEAVSQNLMLLRRGVVAVLLGSVLVLAGCTSSGSSTASYGGPSVSSSLAKRASAKQDVKAAKRDVRAAKKELKALERKMSRAERKLKSKRTKSDAKAALKKQLRKDKRTLRSAKRSVRKAERKLDRAIASEKRATKAIAAAKKRKAEAERKLAAEKRRQAAEKAKQQKLAKAEASVEGSSTRLSLFRSSDPALKNIKDYKARVDGEFALQEIPVEKMNKRLYRQQVRYRTKHKPGTILVDTNAKFLYLVQRGGTAMRYGIGVGKAGFEWSGSAHIGWKQKWPKWTPPSEMIARRPSLEKYSAANGGMPGGPANPLGARALYLMQGNVDTLYRLHGTPQWASIGTAASSGCIRLINQDVIDLYERVPTGAKVIVL